MCRAIRRRDPTRPGFWYLSYTHPHPPLVPLSFYWDLYRDIDPPLPDVGEWASDFESLPYRVKQQRSSWHVETEHAVRIALRGFYALCTQIDHQLRLVIGTLREEGLLDNTIILFTADHGDMLGQHGLWAKRLFYEGSSGVPMILVDRRRDDGGSLSPPLNPPLARGEPCVDDRPVGLQDVMPTLLDLAGVEVPDSCTGLSMAGDERRGYLYGECNEGKSATRMIHDGRHKLIYYAAGNRTQLFDLADDPGELHDLANSRDHAAVRERLTGHLIGELYGSDLAWVPPDAQSPLTALSGMPEPEFTPSANRGLSIQRGIHWPPPPVVRPEETSGEW